MLPAFVRYGCITGDNAGFFHIDGCTKCEGGMDECLNTEAVMEYSRVYPEAIAGVGNYFHFDTEIREAVLIYQPNPDIDGATVLRIPLTWLYKDGFKVAISPVGVATWTQGCCDLQKNSTLEVEINEEWRGQEISVVVSLL